MKLCKTENCGKKYYALGFCCAHYQKHKRYDGNTDSPICRSKQLLEIGKAYCSCCETTKIIENFSLDLKTPSGRRRYCKECESDKSKEQFKKHRNRIRNNTLKRRFGISLENYNSMLEEQNGVCAICKLLPTKTFLSVDHNHKNGKVRKLLCQNCNAGLGMFKENVEFLKTAIEYLKNHEL